MAALTLGALLLAAPAGAQDVLTLERAVAAALANGPGLAALDAARGEAEAAAEAARARRLPEITFGETWQRGNEPVYVFGARLDARRFTTADFAGDALTHPDATTYVRTSLAIRHVVFDGGRTGGAVTAAAAAADGADAARLAAANDTALAATRAYGRLFATLEARRAAESAVRSAEEDHALAERRREAGTVTDADVLAVAVHLADVRQRAIGLAGEADVLRAELNRLIGAPLDAVFALVEPAGDDGLADSIAALQDEALAARPEIAGATAAVRAADGRRRAARGAWWPVVAAQAAYDLHGTTPETRAGSWIVGADLRWTWSVGGATAAGTRGASLAATRARAELDDLRGAVRLEVLAAARTREAASAREAVGRASVDLARESQRIIRDRYEAGLATVTDVLRAATAVLDAEGRRAAALADRVTAEAGLRRALGRLPRYEVSQ